MNIEYVARHFTLDDAIREYTEDKLGKVSKFVEEPVEVRVIFETRKHHYIADVHVAHRFGILQATEETESMQDSVNLAVDKIEKQARRARKKFMDRRRRADRGVQEDSRWPMEVLEAPTSTEGQEAPRILKSTHLSIVPMSLDAAFRQLEGLKNDFIIYRHPENDRIQILYKRKDGNFGLLVPEL
jgi:putative sigma-54 modulation protein